MDADRASTSAEAVAAIVEVISDTEPFGRGIAYRVYFMWEMALPPAQACTSSLAYVNRSSGCF